MLPTFVIGLREGVEAALIVAIIAGFLRQEGRRDALRPMWLGVGAAVAICVAVGVALELLDQELPAAPAGGARDGRRHRRGGDRHVHDRLDAAPRARPLRPAARGAPARRWRAGSTGALVAMAFFAVFREGLETVVFLLAVFQNADDPASAGAGAVLGLAAAVADRAASSTAAASSSTSRASSASPASCSCSSRPGWWRARSTPRTRRAGSTPARTRRSTSRWLVVPGTWTSALLTGMLGWQPQPTDAEVIGYLLYLVPADAVRAVAARSSARAWRGTARTTTLLLLLVLALAGLRLERRRQAPPARSRSRSS